MDQPLYILERSDALDALVGHALHLVDALPVAVGEELLPRGWVGQENRSHDDEDENQWDGDGDSERGCETQTYRRDETEKGAVAGVEKPTRNEAGLFSDLAACVAEGEGDGELVGAVDGALFRQVATGILLRVDNVEAREITGDAGVRDDLVQRVRKLVEGMERRTGTD